MHERELMPHTRGVKVLVDKFENRPMLALKPTIHLEFSIH